MHFIYVHTEVTPPSVQCADPPPAWQSPGCGGGAAAAGSAQGHEGLRVERIPPMRSLNVVGKRGSAFGCAGC